MNGTTTHATKGGQPAAEDRYAGHALAWTGAAATVLGLTLLLLMAAQRGWIGPEARVGLVAVISLLLLGAGGRLYERRGRTDAAKAMTATGIIGLDGSLVVATGTYHLLAPVPAVTLALAGAAALTALCLRWEAHDLAATAMLSALIAPFALGVDDAPLALSLLAASFAAVAGVCAMRDWPRLALAAFTVVTPQWVAHLGFTNDLSPAAAVAVLVTFALLGAAVAVGLEVRERRDELRGAAAVLVAVNALVCAAVGYGVLFDLAGPAAANAWLALLAAAHLVVGARSRRIGPELRITALTLGVLLGDIAAAAIFDGVWLAAAWATSTVLFAALNRTGADGSLAASGLALHTGLAVGHLLLVDAQPSALHQGFDAPGLLALSLVAASSIVSAQLSRPAWRTLLQALALTVTAYGTFALCDGLALVVALAVEAAALGRIARREADAPAAGVGAVAYLGLASLVMLLETDAPSALLTGTTEPLMAAAAVAVCAAAGATLVRRPGFPIAVAATLLYGLSIELVGAFAHAEQGQVALSVFLAVTGVATVLAGLLRDERTPRVAGLALLGLAASKVVMYDLAELDELYRVLSCVALGLLLLAGGFAWQRLRPSAPPDLRRVAAALR